MRVLVACECSGAVRDAFRALGHQAVSCDLQPTERPGLHYQGDVRDLLDGWEPVNFQGECDPEGDGWCQVTDQDPSECLCFGPTQDGIEYMEKDGVMFGRPEDRPKWDLMIAHPPCTDLAVSGARHFKKKGLERIQAAADFFNVFMWAPIKRICIENPVGLAARFVRPADQIIQPWQFGDEAQKTTCLWLVGLPQLKPTKIVGKGEMVTFASGKTMPKWYADASGDARTRSKTFPGIAAAMAAQWSVLDD